MLKTFVPSLKEVVTLKHLRSKDKELTDISITNQDIALIQYTSGSTGDPKGITLTHANILANIRSIGSAIPIKPTDVGVSWLPLYHNMGLMTWLGSLYFGIPVTIMSPITFLTRPERWLWAIHYHRATISGGPNFEYELCVKKINPSDLEGLDLSSWRFAFNGAEAIHPKTLDRFSKKFTPFGFQLESLVPVYGLAESTVGLAFPKSIRPPLIDKIQRDAFEIKNKAIPITSDEKYLEFVGCGEPMKDHDIRIVNDAGAVISERVVGNLQYRGASAMQGYYHNPSATQKAIHDGWWDTGDLAYLVGKEVFITGRKKDIIIRAGRNISPEEVEEIVSEVSNIRKGCVIAFGVHNPALGTEKLVVVAEIYPSSQGKQRDIRTKIIESMAINLGIPPDAVILVPPHTISKTSSGKLQRSSCKAAYLERKLFKQPLPAKFQFIKFSFESVLKKVSGWLMSLAKLLYTLYIGLVLLLFVPIIWIIIPLSPSYAAKLCRRAARFFCRMACCPITVAGRENIHLAQPVIYVANHSS